MSETTNNFNNVFNWKSLYSNVYKIIEIKKMSDEVTVVTIIDVKSPLCPEFITLDQIVYDKQWKPLSVNDYLMQKVRPDVNEEVESRMAYYRKEPEK